MDFDIDPEGHREPVTIIPSLSKASLKYCSIWCHVITLAFHEPPRWDDAAPFFFGPGGDKRTSADATSMTTYGEVPRALINVAVALKPLSWRKAGSSESRRVKQSRQPHKRCESLKCHWRHVDSSSPLSDLSAIQYNDLCSRHAHRLGGRGASWGILCSLGVKNIKRKSVYHQVANFKESTLE